MAKTISEIMHGYNKCLKDCGLAINEQGNLFKTENNVHNVGKSPAFALYHYAFQSGEKAK